MRRIDKTKILSSKYKEWLDKLNRDKVKHPQSRIYYTDVVMNLLHCQKGVCAYTETPLCLPELFDESNWEEGKYKISEPEPSGELEHFDPKLKEDRRWEWDNLFVVDAVINRKKRNKEVDDILKPDSAQYSPDKYLEYDVDTHCFIPNTGIEDETLRQRIKRMISVLHLNYASVRNEREIYLTMVFKLREVSRPIRINCFFTACRMANLE